MEKPVQIATLLCDLHTFISSNVRGKLSAQSRRLRERKTDPALHRWTQSTSTRYYLKQRPYQVTCLFAQRAVLFFSK